VTAQILKHPATVSRAFESASIPAALAEWISAAIPVDNDIRQGLRQVRARSRDAAQNDDHMAMFLRLVEVNVIGRQGITVQAKPRRASGQVDQSLATRIEDAWAEQCERGNWTMCGQHSRVGASRLGVRVTAQDGEILLRVHEASPNAPTGFAVEIIDAEALDIDYNTTLSNGNIVRMGVEMTRYRRPVAYWLFEEPQIPQGGYRNGTRRVRVPAEDIIHPLRPEYAWQSRGVPWAATALRRMKMLNGYEEAAITAARGAAVKSAQYVREEWADPQSMPAGMQQEGRLEQDLTPGAIEIPPYGLRLDTLDWQWPNIEHGQFVKDAVRGFATGLGVSYPTLGNDLEGVNFSSIRHGVLTERDLWMMMQDWWIDWVERPLYRRWLAYAVRTGRISRRNGAPLHLERLADVMHATYQGRRWPWVDPLKDQQAAQMAILMRTRSISDLVRESGRDPEEVWAELRSDLKALQDMPPASAWPEPPAPDQQEPFTDD
jgi:lambda family phage portal protein